MQQHSKLAGRDPNTVLTLQSNGAALCAEELDATRSFAANLQPAQSDRSVLGGPGGKQTWVKRALLKERSVMEYFLATIRAESNRWLQTPRATDDLAAYCERDQHEHETSYTIYPATRLIRLGVRHGLRLRFLSSSTQGWDTTLKAFSPVPDDSLIFEFCKEGNIAAVRRLLSSGHASVRDTDSRGYAPLHISLLVEIKPVIYRSVLEI